MDNRVNLPHYKYYLDSRSGQRFDGFVAFLNVYPAPNAQILGILFAVNDQEIQRLDQRERNYQRLEISQCLTMPPNTAQNFPPSWSAWVYRGLDAAEQRYRQGVAVGKIAIAQPYADTVAAAYTSLGPAALQNYQSTTDPPPIPILPLHRRAT